MVEVFFAFVCVLMSQCFAAVGNVQRDGEAADLHNAGVVVAAAG